MHIIAAKAVAFLEALKPDFKQYQQNILDNAQALASGLMKRGVKLVSGGTDNHLMLVDLRGTGVSGKELQYRLDEVNITCNKNGIPYDPEKPTITSGVRLGTPAVTSRGMTTADMDEIADLINLTLTDYEGSKADIIKRVDAITSKYTLYPEY